MFGFRAKKQDKPYLGYLHDKKGPSNIEVGFPGGESLITIGPPGTGKSMGLIVPNVASLRRSMLIVDPKGEIAAITARHRARLGEVVIFNPFGMLADYLPHLKSNGFNPLLPLDPRSEYFYRDASELAEALIEANPHDSQPHWAESAQDTVAALIMWERRQRGSAATLGHVRDMLCESGYVDQSGQPHGILKTIQAMENSPFQDIKNKVGRIASYNREIQSIISHAITQTKFIDDPLMRAELARGGFDFAAMKQKIVTIYLIIPSVDMARYKNWLRVMVVVALNTLLRSPPPKALPPVLLLLDEFAQLGYLPPVANALAICRGPGVQMWPFVQDLNQLHAIYGNGWQTFIGCCGSISAYAPRDWFTAEYLAKMCGTKTVYARGGIQTEHSGAVGNATGTVGPHSVPVFRPEDLMMLPPGRLLNRATGQPLPFFTDVPVYTRTRFHAGLDANPMFHGG